MNTYNNSENNWVRDSNSFDSVAELYDLYRPSYPSKIIEIIHSITRIPKSGKILEIGSGTGKATKLFIENGYNVHCIDPGNNLVEVAKHKFAYYPDISYEVTRFEDWRVKENYFDLIASAQAFHWVDPAIGYRKVNKSLKSGRYIALFWNMYVGFDRPIDKEIEDVYKEHVPDLAKQREKIEEVIKQREVAINNSGEFTDVSVHRVEWSKTFTTEKYLGLLNTYSDHICIPEKTRNELFKGIAEVFQHNGGLLKKPYLTVLYLGKKVE